MATAEKKLSEANSVIVRTNEQVMRLQRANQEVCQNSKLKEEKFEQEINKLREELRNKRISRYERQQNDRNDRERSFDVCSFIREKLSLFLPFQNAVESNIQRKIIWNRGNFYKSRFI